MNVDRRQNLAWIGWWQQARRDGQQAELNTAGGTHRDYYARKGSDP
jgi:hypothetical protein